MNFQTTRLDREVDMSAYEKLQQAVEGKAAGQKRNNQQAPRQYQVAGRCCGFGWAFAGSRVDILFAQSVLVAVLLKAAAGVDHEDAFSFVSILFVYDDNTSWDTGAEEQVSWKADDALNISFAENGFPDRFFRIASE